MCDRIHLSFVICHLSFVICHLSFVILATLEKPATSFVICQSLRIIDTS
ncbi:hypothetical protein [Coleofasciculus sp. F4-SAH-05]